MHPTCYECACAMFGSCDAHRHGGYLYQEAQTANVLRQLEKEREAEREKEPS